MRHGRNSASSGSSGARRMPCCARMNSQRGEPSASIAARRPPARRYRMTSRASVHGWGHSRAGPRNRRSPSRRPNRALSFIRVAPVTLSRPPTDQCPHFTLALPFRWLRWPSRSRLRVDRATAKRAPRPRPRAPLPHAPFPPRRIRSVSSLIVVEFRVLPLLRSGSSR